MKSQMKIPADGLKGLKENWKKDLPAGLIISLLSLPLCLGIAQASDFPPIMGVLTAIIGGTIGSLLAGSPLNIKSPAAGLIVIVAGAVSEFGGGDHGWKIAAATIAVGGILQVALGLLKFGKLVNYFPLSVVHGMLGAIGFIILSKQLHVLMGVNPIHTDGMKMGKPIVEPLEVFAELPQTFKLLLLNHEHQVIFLVGIICLMIVFGLPAMSNKFLKKTPAPLAVLIIAIPLAALLSFYKIKGGLLHIDNIFKVVDFNAGFDGIISRPVIFIKYVLMFAFIGSLESSLAVKAIDLITPFKQKVKYNKDIIAIGIGNAIGGTLGGLPMISEVAKSSVNVSIGAKTRWANFFHGTFLLIFLLLLVPVIELIPKVALAAILIGVGYKLASVKEFIHILKIGWWELVAMIATTITILLSDILTGVVVGLAVVLVMHYIAGLPFKYTFKPDIELLMHKDRTIVYIRSGAVITNLPGIIKKLESLPKQHTIFVDLSECYLIDYTSQIAFEQFQKKYVKDGGRFEFTGMERHKHISKDKLSNMFLPREVRKDIKERRYVRAHTQRPGEPNHEH